jgi:hypothetical protein
VAEWLCLDGQAGGYRLVHVVSKDAADNRVIAPVSDTEAAILAASGLIDYPYGFQPSSGMVNYRRIADLLYLDTAGDRPVIRLFLPRSTGRPAVHIAVPDPADWLADATAAGRTKLLLRSGLGDRPPAGVDAAGTADDHGDRTDTLQERPHGRTVRLYPADG